MAEINNSLAAQIQSQPLDISKPLLAAGQIKALQTKSALEEAQTGQVQQETGYRQFQQDQNAGYRVPDVNTLAEAHQKQLGVAGQIGNMLVGDQSLASRKQAIQAAKDSGVKIDPQVEQHILTAPASQVKQYGQNMQKAGQASTSNIEQDPSLRGQRSAADVHGTQAGTMGIEPPPLVSTRAPVPSSKAIMGDDEAVKAGRYSPTPEQTSRGIVNPPDPYAQPGALKSSVMETEAKGAVAKEALEKSQKDYGAAQALLGRVPAIAHDIDTLGPAWMGAGAETKTHFAKGWNGLVDTVAGITGTQPNQKMMFDPTKIATSEAFYKEQIRAGMELINSSFGGGKEAASIVQMGKAAVAGQGNTYLGAKFVLSTIEAAARRQADLHEFKLESGGPLATAEVRFNKLHPPQAYAFNALAQNLPPGAVEYLQKNPGTAKSFDDAFHAPGLGQYLIKGNAQ